jgi:hypothetical protein
MREHIRAALAYLDSLGLKGRIEHGGKHPRLVFEHGGRELFVCMAGTPCNRHYAGNHIRQAINRAIRNAGGTTT